MKKENMKTDKIFESLMDLYNKILALTHSVSIKEGGIVDIKELANYAKTAKTIGDSIIKLSLYKDDIKAICKTEEKTLGIQMNTVYDIVTLEDILQKARERFKDELYLIESHQNDVEIIKKAAKLLDDALHQDDKQTSWHKPKTLNDATLFSSKPLPSDEQNLKMFQDTLNQVRKIGEEELDSG